MTIRAENCQYKIWLLNLVHQQGVPKTRAEIIPTEPDADNAAEGRRIKLS